MEDFEKLGVFYLGREKEGNSLLLYDSRHLTTHAMIVGMTGSGKTGLAVSVIEEAAIDGVPAILIDPKGDLADLLLQFPELRPEDFKPWIDPDAARREGATVDELAAKTAENWKSGLAKWGEDGERIRRLSNSAEFAIYTPGDTSGRPLQILKSFDAPKGLDATAFRDAVLNSVSSLLGLVGIEADPVGSREHILLSAIFSDAWGKGRGLDLPAIINFVAAPPFDKVGVFDLETFYPQKDRMKLAMALNGLLASPGFAAWREGEPLDIDRMLHTPSGKPQISIVTIAHLTDAERMFFVSALLNAVLSWMRRQTGTGSLRALLYMDEIFGYFPPNSNPPSKGPMLTLLKQARAFGLGIVLSTQNPVDLDYKGLSNCGTWFIGRLQTDRDKQRVLDGLEGVAADSGSGFDRAGMDKLLSSLGKRVFLMRDASDDKPVLFDTRWALSYLSGPLSLPQIRSLIAHKAAEPEAPTLVASVPAAQPPCASQATAVASAVGSAPESVAATVRMHFVDAKSMTDTWVTRNYVAGFAADGTPDWENACQVDNPAEKAAYGMATEKRLAMWGKMLSSHVYQSEVVTLYRDVEMKLISKTGESLGEFKVRSSQARREKRDAAMDKLKDAYAAKIQRLEDQIRRADERVDREAAYVKQKRLSTALGVGATILSALLGTRGGKKISIGTIGRASSTARTASDIGRKTQAKAAAEESAEILRQRLEDLRKELDEELAKCQVDVSPETIFPEEIAIHPRKSDIVVSDIYFA